MIMTFFGNVGMYNGSIKKGSVCIDFTKEVRSSIVCLVGNYIRLEPEGLEILPLCNDKEMMKIIGVDVI